MRSVPRLRDDETGAAQPIDDSKSESEAPTAIPISREELVEFSENTASLILRNANPAVADFDS